MILGKLDIRGAYTQSGEAKREIYVRPPYELQIWNILWLLSATIYGIVSAGRKWQLASNCAMTSRLGLVFVLGLHQLFHHRASLLTVVIAKYVDDMLIAAKNEEWYRWAVGGIRDAFMIRTSATTLEILFVNRMKSSSSMKY